jgi:hypothetical protein
MDGSEKYDASILSLLLAPRLFLEWLFFYPEDSGDVFLRNISWCFQTTRRYIPTDRTLLNHRWEDLRHHNFLLVSFRQINLISKCSVFWDVTPCSPVKFNRRFGGICRFHLKGRRINQERNRYEALYTGKLRACWAIVNFSERTLISRVSWDIITIEFV